ncbi:hypothetical protein [Pseudomonas oryzihabitans]|uniref:hypothetical protein n=1 Tax=Pseudomonas oryzihabitans TaxID=47885 RepID=UPI0016425A66|nr:hypothetical protein [Pseudomonas psychrotolerans]
MDDLIAPEVAEALDAEVLVVEVVELLVAVELVEPVEEVDEIVVMICPQNIDGPAALHH